MGALVKFIAQTCVDLCLDSPLVLFDYVSVSKSVAYYFDYCSFLINFEIRQCDASRFF